MSGKQGLGMSPVRKLGNWCMIYKLQLQPHGVLDVLNIYWWGSGGVVYLPSTSAQHRVLW